MVHVLRIEAVDDLVKVLASLIVGIGMIVIVAHQGRRRAPEPVTPRP